MADALPLDEADGGTGSQTTQALLGLRELILGGQLRAGERIAEVGMSERLGVSRTPLRAALIKLEQEGLLEAGANDRGYRVRRFGRADIEDAIELRGTLEGLAARLAAERGAPPELLREAHEALAAIDAMFERNTEGSAPLAPEEFAIYVEHNERFHALLGRMPGSETVRRQLERAAAAPFASPNAFMAAQARLASSRRTLVVAQEQHRQVLDAIERREGTRAEALMREHARLARRNLEHALDHQPSLQLVPGGALIQALGR